MKMGWLFANDRKSPDHALPIPDNRALTALMWKYRKLINSNVHKRTRLDYAAVSSIFDDALDKKEGWPADNRIERTLLNKPNIVEARSILQQIISVG